METSMMCYYLLRDNQESGPYTLNELKATPLFTTDLIWIEGESTCWKHPVEIDCLKNSIKMAEPRKKAIVRNDTASSQETTIAEKNKSVSTSNQWISASAADNKLPLEEDLLVAPSFEDLKKKYEKKAPKKSVWKKQSNVVFNLFGITTLFVGLMMAAIMVKKAVENIEFEPLVATADAKVIESEKLPVSTSTHAAMAGIAPTSNANNSSLLEEASKQKQIILQETRNPIEKSPALAATTAALMEEPKNATPDEQEKGFINANSETVSNSSTEESIQAVNKEEPEEKKEKSAGKPTLHLSANSFKVGILGGISDLELLISNLSPLPVNKAVVEIEFLKPNGKVANSKTLEVSGIAPGGSKKIAVPDNSRGVNVRYRLVNIEA